jgi:DNA recombination protein RmuC
MTLVWAACASFLIGAALAYLIQASRIAKLTERAVHLETLAASERSLRDKMQNEFKLAASEALQSANQQFLDSAIKDLRQVKTEADASLDLKNKEISGSFQEIKQRIDEYQERVRKFEDERSTLHTQLQGTLRQVLDAEQAMRSETAGLKRVLTSSAGVRGKWGESTLIGILEQNQKECGIDFWTQESYSAESGCGDPDGRPDFVIRLRDNKRLIIDSKAVIGEYVLAQDTDDPEKQKEHYKKLVQNIRGEFTRLSRKEYQSMVDSSVPYVIMFIPSEAAIRAAFAEDPTIFEEASSKKIIMASPMTIIPLIYLIANSWKQYRMAANAKELGGAVEQLGDRLFSFVGHLKDLQSGIQKCADSWNGAVGSWEKRVTPQIDKVKNLGGSLKETEELSSVEPVLRQIPDKTGVSR